jgi:hypothetical protein
MRPTQAKIFILIAVQLILIGFGEYLIKEGYNAFGIALIAVNVIFIILNIFTYAKNYTDI